MALGRLLGTYLVRRLGRAWENPMTEQINEKVNCRLARRSSALLQRLLIPVIPIGAVFEAMRETGETEAGNGVPVNPSGRTSYDKPFRIHNLPKSRMETPTLSATYIIKDLHTENDFLGAIWGNRAWTMAWG